MIWRLELSVFVRIYLFFVILGVVIEDQSDYVQITTDFAEFSLIFTQTPYLLRPLYWVIVFLSLASSILLERYSIQSK